MNNSSAFQKYVVGALLGGLFGAVIGLLFAQRSGAETREMIRQEVGNKSRETAKNLKVKTEAIKEKVQDLSTLLGEKGKEAIACFKEGSNKSSSESTAEATIS